MRRTNPRDSKKYTEWMEYAEHDLVAAQLLTQNEKTLLLSAFHSHQAIEKTLKAFILCEKGYAPDGHNIIYLCKQAMRTEPAFSDWIDECIALNNYYIQTRYPPDFPLDINKDTAVLLANFSWELYKFALNELAKFD